MDGRGRAARSFPRLETGFVPTSNPQTRRCHPPGLAQVGCAEGGAGPGPRSTRVRPQPSPNKEQGGAGQPRLSQPDWGQQAAPAARRPARSWGRRKHDLKVSLTPTSHPPVQLR